MEKGKEQRYTQTRGTTTTGTPVSESQDSNLGEHRQIVRTEKRLVLSGLCTGYRSLEKPNFRSNKFIKDLN